MLGGKKKQKAKDAAAAAASRPEWEYYNVSVGSVTGSGSKQITETISKMEKSGWEFISQSAGEWRGQPQTNLMFRRPNAPGNKKPPVENTRMSCCMLWLITPMTVASSGALAWRIRKRRRVRAWMALVAGAGLAASLAVPALARDTARDRLPSPQIFGPEWRASTATADPADLSAAFVDGAYGVYGGPAGARVVIGYYVVAEGMTAVRQSWQDGNAEFEAYRSGISYNYETQRETETAAYPLPDGCADARRTYGVDKIGIRVFPVGLTLCAADPNVILMIYASGTVNGLTGYAASDFVATSVLGETPATPEPVSD